MLAVQPRGLGCADEELGAVGVGTSVGHGQDTGASVLQGEVLIGKLLTVDGLATSALKRTEKERTRARRKEETSGRANKPRQKQAKTEVRKTTLLLAFFWFCFFFFFLCVAHCDGDQTKELTYVAAGKVATLAHEVGDDAVEAAALEAKALLASAEGAEVLGSLGHNIGTELKLDAAEGGAVGGDVKVNLGVAT